MSGDYRECLLRADVCTVAAAEAVHRETAIVKWEVLELPEVDMFVAS